MGKKYAANNLQHNMAEAKKLRYQRAGSNRLAQLVGVRVKSQIAPRLGDRLWKQFAREARRFGNVCFVGAFVPDKVTCSGSIGGALCPVAGAVDLDLSTSMPTTCEFDMRGAYLRSCVSKKVKDN